MRRPLEDLPPLDRYFTDTHDCRLSFVTGAQRKQFLTGLFGFLTAPQLVIDEGCDYDPLQTYADKRELLLNLGLSIFDHDLKSGQVLYCPSEPAPGDTRRNFPQWAALWEQSDRQLRRALTLQLEIAAGFHMISLLFTPMHPDYWEKNETPLIQLQSAKIFSGHDSFDVEIGRCGGEHDVVRDILLVARDMIEAISCCNPDADRIMQDRMMDIVSYLRARDEALNADYAAPVPVYRSPEPQITPKIP